MTDDNRPVPEADRQNGPYWQHAAREEFVLPRCADCGTYAAPPVNNCGTCLGEQFDWVPASGEGTVYSFLEYRRAWTPDWADHVPYLVGVVQLAEGPRIVTGLDYEVDGGLPAVDAAVRVVFEPRGEAARVPVFRSAR